jgi:hypothetical protein
MKIARQLGGLPRLPAGGRGQESGAGQPSTPGPLNDQPRLRPGPGRGAPRRLSHRDWLQLALAQIRRRCARRAFVDDPQCPRPPGSAPPATADWWQPGRIPPSTTPFLLRFLRVCCTLPTGSIDAVAVLNITLVAVPLRARAAEYRWREYAPRVHRT